MSLYEARIRVATDGRILTIVTREQAIALGWRYFYTGAPCRRGHIVARYTSNGACFECKRENERLRPRRKRAAPPAPSQVSIETPEQRAFRRFPIDKHKARWD